VVSCRNVKSCLGIQGTKQSKSLSESGFRSLWLLCVCVWIYTYAHVCVPGHSKPLWVYDCKMSFY